MRVEWGALPRSLSPPTQPMRRNEEAKESPGSVVTSMRSGSETDCLGSTGIIEHPDLPGQILGGILALRLIRTLQSVDNLLHVPMVLLAPLNDRLQLQQAAILLRQVLHTGDALHSG